jgi:chromosome segregation ATPase
MKRGREDSDGFSDSFVEPNKAPELLSKKQKTSVDDVANMSMLSIEPIDNTQVNVAEALTQVDDRWNKNKRRRRTLDKMTQAPVGANSNLTVDDESPSQAGIIEKLELFNFMCHSAFSLNFGPQTNFIIGRNGSGKSAVLTGISVALGAKATDTDRGNSLKNLIMHGKNVARAIVTLKNEGPEAYLPEEFGPKIIIERVLKTDRPHSLTIKNYAGKTISTTKKTIESILEYFGITIANPMTILTQTEAKTFLAHSSDKDKFNSFMAGTRLKESFDNIKHIESNANEIRDILTKNKDVYDEMKAKFEEARKIWNSFKDSDEYSKRKDLLIGKKIWVEYKENEKLYKKADKILQNKRSEIHSHNEKLEVIANELNDLEQSKKNLQEGELENYKQKLTQTRGEKNDSKTSISQTKDEMEQITHRINSIKKNINEYDQQIEQTEREIRKERKRIEGSNEENIERLKAFREKQKEKIADLIKGREALLSKIEFLKQETKEIDKKSSESLSGVNVEIRNLESKIKDARHQEQSNRPEAAFGHNMNNLMRDIRSQRFQNQVIGPLGLHIELKKDYQKWSSVLETILQRTMNSFLVSNHRDAQTLSSRVKFFSSGSEITVRQNEIFDFSQNKPNSKYPSVLDVLKIQDENLRCFLVDSLKLHSTLLIPDRMEAQKELDNDYQNKISSAICFVQNNVLRIYKRNGAFQSDPVYITNRAPTRLRTEGDSFVLRLERDLNELKKSRNEKLAESQRKSRTLSDELRNLQNKLSDMKKNLREIQQSVDKVDDKLEKLESGTSKLDSLVNEKEELESTRAMDIQRLEPIQEEFHKAQKLLQNQMEIYKSISEDYQNAKNLYNEKRKEYDGIDSNITFRQDNIRNLNNTNIKLENDISKLSEYITKTDAEMKALAESALNFCSLEDAEITSKTTAQSIDDEIRSIDRYLQEIENRQGITKRQAEINLLKARSELKEIETKFSQTIELHKNLHKALENRLNNLLQTTYLTFQEVESVFITALKIRRFRGKIEFNVKKGTLTLKVATKDTGPLRSVESFSGGEKSYGQIAFLFAIWGPMHSRIRGLDEFDVFMDNINRRIALKLILSKVAENPKRQTIFITPLGVANVEGLDKKSVYIHEISPPGRANL